MFGEIYPKNVGEARSTLGLFEELGELAEAIRVFERYPKYLAGEAADVFSYLMGIANEHALRIAQEAEIRFSLEAEFLKRYPGLCVQCGCHICVCPVVPEATVGRLAKELDLASSRPLFGADPADLDLHGRQVAATVLQKVGGYSAVATQFPLDRGETNKALVVLCLRLADSVATTNSVLADKLRSAAIEVGSAAMKSGSRERSQSVNDVIQSLRAVWPSIEVAIQQPDRPLATAIDRLIKVQDCRFGIVTALPKEFAAMRAMLDAPSEHPIAGDPNRYVVGTIPTRDGKGAHAVAVTMLTDKGNNGAAAAAAHILRSFPTIKDVLMVGIAGGVPSPDNVTRHVRLGDVVVSNKEGIFQYDSLKIEQDSIGVRSYATAPSALMIDAINMLEANRIAGQRPWDENTRRGDALEGSSRPGPDTDVLKDWLDIPKDVEHPHDATRSAGQPKIHFGKIGSSNVLLKDSKIRDTLRLHGVLAVEMEGSGIADGTWAGGCHYIVIRGICDYCDSGKSDLWQGYAAVVAAAYARALISEVPIATLDRRA